MRRSSLVLLLAASAAAASALDAPARRPAPGEPARLEVAGLGAPVGIVTDRWGIPHLTARSLDDLYLAWGWVSARDRLWQLERARRAARGRLWEWAGNATLRADGGAQLFRLEQRARAIWARERADPGVRMALERFAAGVNAYLARCRAGAAPWPREFVRLGRRPDDWRPEDSVMLLLGMGLTLDLSLPELREGRDIAAHGRAWVEERRREESRWTYDSIPDSAARRLYGARGRGAPRTPAAGASGARACPPALLAEAARTLDALRGPAGEEGAGRASNVFAVGSRRSASGLPMLADDPQLDFADPSPLYVLQVRVPGVVDAAGASLPGLPTIVSGRNRDCAWGETALAADVVDVYADTLSADGRRVRWRGGWAPVIQRPLDLRWRFLGVGLPLPWLVRRYTPRGPVIAFDRPHRLALALRWSALEDARIRLGRVLGLERSRDAEELAARFRTLVTPTLNLVAVDRAGRVIYQTCGLVPRRAADPGPGPLPDDGRHEWVGWIPADSMPAWRPPPAGFVVNSNNRPVGPAYPWAWPRYDLPPDRALRIAQRLAGDPSITLADLASVQNDTYSTMASRFVPLLVSCADSLRGRLSPRARAALDTLRSWDFLARRPRVAPTLWRAWYAALARRGTLGDLPGGMFARLSGASPPGAPSERPAVAAAAALDSALADLERLLGPDLPGWRWERAHRARFPRDLERWFPREREWRTPSVAMDGDNSSPCAGPSLLPRSVEVRHGPVFRHLVDLAVPDSSWIVLPPRNVDGPESPARACDLTAPWAGHAYVPLLLDPGRIAAERDRSRGAVLALTPAR